MLAGRLLAFLSSPFLTLCQSSRKYRLHKFQSTRDLFTSVLIAKQIQAPFYFSVDWLFISILIAKQIQAPFQLCSIPLSIDQGTHLSCFQFNVFLSTCVVFPLKNDSLLLLTKIMESGAMELCHS